MKITISDVAQKAGVSKTTVSRILNGNYDHAKEETRERVLKAIAELDYRPNALAKGLKSMRTNVIGIVLSNLKNSFWTDVLEGVEHTCNDLGFNLMICNSNEDPTIEQKYIRELQMRQVDGIVINPTVRNQEIYKSLVESRFPMVSINRIIPHLEANHVLIDNIKGAYMGVEHLINNGKSKIGLIVYQNPHISTWQERIEGYKKALLTNGFSTSDYRILELKPKSENVREETLKFLKKYPDIDAIFSTSNMLSLEVIEAIKDMNFKIPEDIAFVSYDETQWSKHLQPPLTTISQPGYEMGRAATEILINSIKSNNHEPVQRIVFEPQLIVRQSCGTFSKVI